MGLTTKFRAGLSKIFNLASESVTRTRITKSWSTVTDDIDESATTTTSVSCIIQFVNLEDENEYMGVLKVGDAVAYFKNDADVALGDQITHDSIKYEIEKIFADPVEGNKVFWQAWLKRKEY